MIFSFRFNTTRGPLDGKRERLTVGTSAVPITPATYTVAETAAATKYARGDRKATAAVIQVFDDAIYFTLDGTTPSATVGFEAAVGDVIELDSLGKIQNFQAIRKTGDAELEILPLFGA